MTDPVRHIDDSERRARIAHRHAIAPGARAADPVAATRAMTVLHATEPATVYLSLHARGRRAHGRGCRHGPLRRAQLGQATRNAAYLVRLSPRPAARGVGECQRSDRAHARHPLRQGTRDGRPCRGRIGLVGRCEGRGHAATCRRFRTLGSRTARTGPGVGRTDRDGSGEVVRRQLPRLAPGAHTAGRRGRDRSRPQRRPLAGVPPEVHPDAGLAGRGTRAEQVR